MATQAHRIPCGMSPAATLLVRSAEALADRDGVAPTEHHLLLACLFEKKGFARDVLSYLGVDLDKARSLVLQHVTDQHAHSLSVLIAMATEEADQRPFAYTTTQEGRVRIIGTTHVLVALFKGEESLARRVLSDQKITPDRIYEAQKDVLEQTKGPYNRPPEGMR